MSIGKDVMKELEQADEKLDQAKALEARAIVTQKEATALRDESDALLRKTQEQERHVHELSETHKAYVAKTMDEFRNREATLAAKTNDLEQQTKQSTEVLDSRGIELSIRLSNIEKREMACRERETYFNELAIKYKAISDVINDAL